MELHMHTHHLESRAPDWVAAAVSGFLGGAAIMVLELLWSALITGSSPWAVSHRISAIVMGPDALRLTEFNVPIVATALITHYILGIIFGLVMCMIIAPFHFDSSVGMVLISGVVFGLALYVFNFYGMSRIFPWFSEMRGGAALVTHVIFGMVTGLAYWALERRERRNPRH
ncbi:hypothetical protein HAV38_03045 [Glaciimonas immobilis]|nr:hypothetical protein [Glaciimonas immobilis]KAF3999559.1 hypothetical protein HAV38_03045 [Glaciimonas immobilis]